MSLPRDKAPVADAIGAFLLYAGDAAARGIEPLAAAGLGYAGAIRFSVSSIPSVIAPRTI